MHKNLKRLRLLNNLTQEAIAKKLNISQNAYSLMENGKTKIDVQRIRQLIEIFNVNSTELLIEIPGDIKKEIQTKVGMTVNYGKQDSTEEMLHLLKEQLKIKDKQIEQLISLLEQLRKIYKFDYPQNNNSKQF